MLELDRGRAASHPETVGPPAAGGAKSGRALPGLRDPRFLRVVRHCSVGLRRSRRRLCAVLPAPRRRGPTPRRHSLTARLVTMATRLRAFLIQPLCPRPRCPTPRATASATVGARGHSGGAVSAPSPRARSTRHLAVAPTSIVVGQSSTAVPGCGLVEFSSLAPPPMRSPGSRGHLLYAAPTRVRRALPHVAGRAPDRLRHPATSSTSGLDAWSSALGSASGSAGSDRVSRPGLRSAIRMSRPRRRNPCASVAGAQAGHSTVQTQTVRGATHRSTVGIRRAGPRRHLAVPFCLTLRVLRLV